MSGDSPLSALGRRIEITAALRYALKEYDAALLAAGEAAANWPSACRRLERAARTLATAAHTAALASGALSNESDKTVKESSK